MSNFGPANRIYLGVDPDFDTTALALFKDTCSVQTMTLQVIRTKGFQLKPTAILFAGFLATNIPEEDYPTNILIEDPRVYLGKGPARHSDILKLGQVAAVLAAVAYLKSETRRNMSVSMLAPMEWKGTVPKPIHQARTYSRLGLSYKKHTDYCSPEKAQLPPHLQELFPKKTDWKHLGDAIGLALCAFDFHRAEQDKQAALTAARHTRQSGV